MVIVMPQELEVWYLLPALRRELTLELMLLGLKQSDVAKKLGVSRSAITQYLQSKRAKKVRFDSKTAKEIKCSAKKLKENGVCLVNEIQKLSRIAKINKVLCKLHVEHKQEHNGCNHTKNNCCKICLV